MLRSAPIGFESLNTSNGKAEAGNFGVVRPYRYVGNDVNLQLLTQHIPNNYVMLKEFRTIDIDPAADETAIKILTRKNNAAKKTFENEIEIVQHLQNNSRHITNPLYARGAVVELENGEKRIASEFTFYNTKVNNIPVASNLNDYLQSRVVGIRWFDPREDVENKKQLSSLFVSITEHIHTSQSQIHQMGVLHLDTALRNFMLSTNSSIKLIDFGLARVMPENGITTLVFNSETAIEQPRTRYDIAARQSKRNKENPKMREISLSINTDLFAKKFTLMELACVIMGGNEHSLTEGLDDKRRVTAKRDGITLSDKKTLEYYLANLTELKEDNVIGMHDPRNQLIGIFIESFGQYLTHIPEAGASKEAILEEDQALFTQAMADFRSKLQVAESEALAHLVELTNPTISGGYGYSPSYSEDETHSNSEPEVKLTTPELFSEVMGIMKGINTKNGSEKNEAIDRLVEIMKDHPDNILFLNAVRTDPNHTHIPLSAWKEIANISEEHEKFIKLNSHIKIQLENEGVHVSTNNKLSK